jgi:hypothetical protein
LFSTLLVCMRKAYLAPGQNSEAWHAATTRLPYDAPANISVRICQDHGDGTTNIMVSLCCKEQATM